MPYITITRGLTIKVPTKGTTNWDETMRTDTFNKISEHDHTGSGNGVQLSTSSISANAITGAKIRLDNNEALRARNAANSADINLLKLDTNNELILQTTVGSANFQDDGLTILDNADNTKIIAFNASNITTGTTRTLSAPDATGTIVLNDNTATISNKTIDADLNTLTNIENADIKAAAAIALNKLAATTASRALVSDGSGFVTAATTTATEIGYVNGVTSAIQTQLNAKAPSASPTFTGTVTTPVTASRALVTGASSELAASATTATELGYVSGVTSAIQTQINSKLPTTITTTGDIIYSSSGTTASRLGIGSAGQVLSVSGGVPAWATNTVSPVAVTNKTTTYTALTTDSVINCTSGTFTVTLYTAVGNNGRELTIVNSGTGVITVDGNSSETINGTATRTLRTQNDSIVIVSDNSNWQIKNDSRKPLAESAIYNTHAGYGSTNTKIPYFTNAVSNTMSYFGTIANSSTNGWSFTASKKCRVTMTYCKDGTTNATVQAGISLNSSQLTTNINGITVADRLAIQQISSIVGEELAQSVSVSVILNASDVLRPHAAGDVPGTAAQCHLTILAEQFDPLD